LLTTAIGHATIAVQGIDEMFKAGEMNRRPKVDKHHFDLMDKLEETGLSPEEYNHVSDWGTEEASYAVHNFENRAEHEIIETDKLFLGHFEHTDRILRGDIPVSSEEVLGHFEERSISLDEENAVKEAERCMSCGMCFECDNCVIFCPQDAVFRVKKAESTLGRYVATDYTR
jgi:ferredoxin